MWKNMGPIINHRKCKSPTNIFNLIDNGNNIQNDRSIAETLNNHFTSVGPKLASKLSKSKDSFTKYLKNPNSNSFFMSPITENFLKDILQSLPSNKASYLKLYHLSLSNL